MTICEYESMIVELSTSEDRLAARCRLRDLSREIRRIAWSPAFRSAAHEAAAGADDAAATLERDHPELGVTAPLPRWEAVHQGGCWSPEVR